MQQLYWSPGMVLMMSESPENRIKNNSKHEKQFPKLFSYANARIRVE